ncbi:subunit 1 of replication factor C [Chloropicon primus]|nr:subunit 1 of replication factor C [Chloropicon primus]
MSSDIRNFFKAAAPKKKREREEEGDDPKPKPKPNPSSPVKTTTTTTTTTRTPTPPVSPPSKKKKPLGIDIGASSPSCPPPPPRAAAAAAAAAASPKKKKKASATPKPPTPKELRQKALKSLKKAIDALPLLDESKAEESGFSLREKTADLNPYNQQGGAEVEPRNRATKGKPPRGEADMFHGLGFVITGALDSLHRNECEDLIKRHGGRVTASVSGKTDFLIVGLDSGSSKVKAAREKKETCRIINEDGLFALIASKEKKSSQDGTTGALPKQQEAEEASGSKPAPMAVDLSPEAGLLWVTKHKPKHLGEVVGNQSQRGLMQSWLRNFKDIHVLKKDVVVRGDPRHVKKQEELREKKAVLVSGPPGLGKTTCAALLAKAQGYFPIIEVNASDTRGKSDGDAKKGLNGKTSNQIRELISNSALPSAAAGSSSKESRGPIVIMDECDGMSGSDRGGIGEVVDCIKNTKIPIICICNDKYLPKMKPLRNVCVELDFRKPDKRMIARRMQQVCEKEGLQAAPVALETLAERSNGDLRILLGYLQQWKLTRDTLTYDDVRGSSIDKDSDISPFKVCDVLLGFEGKNYSISDQLNMVFQDMDLIPLLVQENYVNHRPQVAGNDKQRMKILAKAADGMSYGDWASQVVRGQGEWGIMPYQGVMGAVYPATYVRGQREVMNLYPNEPNMTRFSAWLGKNSSQSKVQRELREVGLPSDYLPLVQRRLSQPLLDKGKEGIDEVVEFMKTYGLVKEDKDAILDSLRPKFFKNAEDPMKKVPTAVKSALTRSLTKAELVRDWTVPKPKAKSKAKAKGKAKKK